MDRDLTPQNGGDSDLRHEVSSCFFIIFVRSVSRLPSSVVSSSARLEGQLVMVGPVGLVRPKDSNTVRIAISGNQIRIHEYDKTRQFDSRKRSSPVLVTDGGIRHEAHGPRWNYLNAIRMRLAR